MKWLISIALTLSLLLVWGCGSDDPPPPKPKPVEIVADNTLGEPSMENPNDAIWDGVEAVTLDVATSNSPKTVGDRALAVTNKVDVQAIQYSNVAMDEYLYVRLQWTDITPNIWDAHFEITSDVPLIFSRDTLRELNGQEDMAMVAIEDATAGATDIWSWRALTTGAGGLAEGFSLTGTTLIPDAAGTANVEVAVANKHANFFNDPNWCHMDTAEFNGYILHWADAIDQQYVIRTQVDTVVVGTDTTIYTNDIYFYQTTGWTVGQKIPGWIIDTGIASRTIAERGSRWDTKTVSAYDTTNAQWTVVFQRMLNTGFPDDVDMMSGNDLEIAIGIFDNQHGFNVMGSRRGFTQKFALKLQ